MESDNVNIGLRYNKGKPKWGLVHWESLRPMVEVLQFGANKYAPGNWMKPMDKREILESLARHLFALLDGEEYDKESGIHHIGHIQCNALFYAYHNQKTINNGKEEKS